MRGMTGLFYETSKLDAQKGIMYRGQNLFEVCEKLKYKGSEEPVSEASLWFLFTGELPNEKQTESVIQNIHHRSKIPTETEQLINSLPKNLHPMTQLSMGVLSTQRHSSLRPIETV
jgi:citrate synthase